MESFGNFCHVFATFEPFDIIWQLGLLLTSFATLGIFGQMLVFFWQLLATFNCQFFGNSLAIAKVCSSFTWLLIQGCQKWYSQVSKVIRSDNRSYNRSYIRSDIRSDIQSDIQSDIRSKIFTKGLLFHHLATHTQLRWPTALRFPAINEGS